MKLAKITNLREQGFPINLRDPDTGQEVSKILPGTRHIRTGPKASWRTEEGSLTVNETELSPHVQLLKGQGALTIDFFTQPDAAPAAPQPPVQLEAQPAPPPTPLPEPAAKSKKPKEA